MGEGQSMCNPLEYAFFRQNRGMPATYQYRENAPKNNYSNPSLQAIIALSPIYSENGVFSFNVHLS